MTEIYIRYLPATLDASRLRRIVSQFGSSLVDFKTGDRSRREFSFGKLRWARLRFATSAEDAHAAAALPAVLAKELNAPDVVVDLLRTDFQKSYLSATSLGVAEGSGYRAAGIIPWRHSPQGPQILLGVQERDKVVGLSFLAGKREPEDGSAEETAAREFWEESGEQLPLPWPSFAAALLRRRQEEQAGASGSSSNSSGSSNSGSSSSNSSSAAGGAGTVPVPATTTAEAPGTVHGPQGGGRGSRGGGGGGGRGGGRGGATTASSSATVDDVDGSLAAAVAAVSLGVSPVHILWLHRAKMVIFFIEDKEIFNTKDFSSNSDTVTAATTAGAQGPAAAGAAAAAVPATQALASATPSSNSSTSTSSKQPPPAPAVFDLLDDYVNKAAKKNAEVTAAGGWSDCMSSLHWVPVGALLKAVKGGARPARRGEPPKQVRDAKGDLVNITAWTEEELGNFTFRDALQALAPKAKR